MTYPEAIRALNKAAWNAVTASKGIVTPDSPDYQLLRIYARETDRLVDELPSDRSSYDFQGEKPALQVKESAL